MAKRFYSVMLHAPCCHSVSAHAAHTAHKAHSALRTQLLVDLVLHRQPVAVPAEAADHVVPRARGVAGDDVLLWQGGCDRVQAAVITGWMQQRRPCACMRAADRALRPLVGAPQRRLRSGCKCRRMPAPAAAAGEGQWLAGGCGCRGGGRCAGAAMRDPLLMPAAVRAIAAGAAQPAP